MALDNLLNDSSRAWALRSLKALVPRLALVWRLPSPYRTTGNIDLQVGYWFSAEQSPAYAGYGDTHLTLTW